MNTISDRSAASMESPGAQDILTKKKGRGWKSMLTRAIGVGSQNKATQREDKAGQSQIFGETTQRDRNTWKPGGQSSLPAPFRNSRPVAPAPSESKGTAQSQPASWEARVQEGKELAKQLRAQGQGSASSGPSTNDLINEGRRMAREIRAGRETSVSPELIAQLRNAGQRAAQPAPSTTTFSPASRSTLAPLPQLTPTPTASRQDDASDRISNARNDYRTMSSQIKNWASEQKDEAILEMTKKMSVLEAKREQIDQQMRKSSEQIDLLSALRKSKLEDAQDKLSVLNDRVKAKGPEDADAVKLGKKIAGLLTDIKKELDGIVAESNKMKSTLQHDANKAKASVEDQIETARRENQASNDLIDNSARDNIDYERAEIASRHNVAFRDRL